MAERNTVQQAVVEQALHQLANHPTAEEVYLQVHQSYPAIGKATVYRTLNKLVANGRALRVPVPNGADRFDHQTHGHYHVRCSQCGSVDDVLLPGLEGLEQQAQQSSGYFISNYVLLFEGQCPHCAEAVAS